MPSTTRRNLLRSAIIGSSIGLAGCTQGLVSPPAKPVSAQEGGANPARYCPEGHPTFDPFWTVDGAGPLGGFHLSVEHSKYALGDTVTCTLQNTNRAPRQTGNPDQYDVQYRGKDAWHTIYTIPHNDVEWASFGVTHEPGEGFTWEFPFTQVGLSNVAPNAKYVLCGPVEPGEYRFVYWGLTRETTPGASNDDYALGAPFTVTNS